MAAGTCDICGCTDNNCRQCIEASGSACFWVDDEKRICSRCYLEICESDLTPEQLEKVKSDLQKIRQSLIDEASERQRAIADRIVNRINKKNHGNI